MNDSDVIAKVEGSCIIIARRAITLTDIIVPSCGKINSRVVHGVALAHRRATEQRGENTLRERGKVALFHYSVHF